jgi:hypothetical protein
MRAGAWFPLATTAKIRSRPAAQRPGGKFSPALPKWGIDLRQTYRTRCVQSKATGRIEGWLSAVLH